MISIVELMNNFLSFIRSRVQVVISEYEMFHQSLEKISMVSAQLPKSAKDRFSVIRKSLTASDQRIRIFGELVSGKQFASVFKNFIIQGLTDLSDLVNQEMLARAEFLKNKRHEIEMIQQNR